MGPRLTIFLVSRQCGSAGWLARLLIEAGDVETNPGATTTHKQVWIFNICHRQIYVWKQISITCNRIEHWVHLRCAGICLAQYTDTGTYHLHKEPRLTTHADITPKALDQTPIQSPDITRTAATQTQTPVPHSPCTHMICKATHPHNLPPRLEPNTYTFRTLHLHLSSHAAHSYQARHLH